MAGIDVSLNQQRARANACANFVYKSYVEIDNMNIEDVKAYTNLVIMVGKT